MSNIKLPSGKACVAKLGPSAKSFYAGSFRLVPIPGPKNTKATILVGCPKMKGRKWFASKTKKITDRQGVTRRIVGLCEHTVGPKKGMGATKGYLKIQKPVGSRCRAGYKLKAFKPVARPKRKAK